jgi:serine/threonine protein kinase
VKEQSRKRKIMHELLMLRTLSGHRNICQIYEVFENKDCFFFVMEYAGRGDLLRHIKKEGRPIEDDGRKFFYQICQGNFFFCFHKENILGLSFMHKKGVLHRDIKLDNILLDENLTPKLCDFGVSRFIGPDEIINEQCGTPAYIAPEIIKKNGYKGFKADIWSLGV